MILNGKIKLFVAITLAVLCCGGMVSCIYDKYPDDQFNDYNHEGQVSLMFQISPLSAKPVSGAGTETVKSLRILVLNDEEIECNRLIDFPQPEAASSFFYNFRWWTDPGIKQLVVIANEASVGELQFDPAEDVTLPSPLPSSLTQLLTAYGPDANNDSQELLDVLNSAYFEPQYTADGGAVALPYTVYYGDINAMTGSAVPMDVHLVPVAAKFEFRFVNFRLDAMKVSDIKLSYYDKANFLLGHVNGDDVTKTFDNTPLYWVDWLAKISAESQKNDNPLFGPNQDLNTLYGWISDYSLPATDDESLVMAFPTGEIDVDPLQIPEGGDPETDGEPGTASTGWFYVPESRNFTNPENSATPTSSQSYYLSMKFTDTGVSPKDPPTFENIAISNLKALFRNTHVVITVRFSEGSVDVYAEIADWNKKYAYGWIVEGQPPSPNPYGVKQRR